MPSLSKVGSEMLDGALPAISGASLTNLDARDLENALPAISGASLTGLPAASSVAFPASQSASADANTLDDYEEGAFTPTIQAILHYRIVRVKYITVINLVFIRRLGGLLLVMDI